MPKHIVIVEPMVERRYTIIDSVNEDIHEIVYRIFASEIADDGDFVARMTVSEYDDDREYDLTVGYDAWSALANAFRFVRRKIIHMHDVHRGRTIMLDGRRAADWT